MKSQSKVVSNNTLIEMPVKAPKGYYYEFVPFKRNIVSIWLCGGRKFLFKDGECARTIHSFYDTKTNKWFAPVNHKTVGKEVDPEDIRPWTAMPIKLIGLEQFFV